MGEPRDEFEEAAVSGGWQGNPLGERMSHEWLRRLVTRHRRVLNRLEPHLGCVVCGATLIDGECQACDYEDEVL